MTELIEWERALNRDDSTRREIGTEGGVKTGLLEQTAMKILNLVKDTAKLATTIDAESVADIYYRVQERGV